MSEQPPLLRPEEPLPAEIEPAVLPVDKPGGITSFAVVRRVRGIVGVKKVGHAGTLDPMATGLLIVLIGRAATRMQDAFMGLPKTYHGTLRLGETTPSYDADTEVVASRDPAGVTDEDLERVARSFVGEVEQVPPMYSAVKVGGERLYRKARRGEDVAREARRVRITRLALTARRGADVDFEVDCSKGTYIRTLAHEIGEALGVGAHLVGLRRVAIGPYHVRDAWDLARLAEAAAARQPVRP